MLRQRRLRSGTRDADAHRSVSRDGIAITTASGRRIVSTPEHVHFAGFKVGRTPQLHMTYLMWKRGHGFRIGTSRTYTNARQQTLAGPAIRLNGEHADAAGSSATFTTEAEARAAETLLSLRYGLPTIPFVARPYEVTTVAASSATRRCSTASSPSSTPRRGPPAARGRGSELRASALQRRDDDDRRTRHGAGSRSRSAATGVAPALSTGSRSSATTRTAVLALERLGLPVRPAYKGSDGWRYESSYADFGKLHETVGRIQEASTSPSATRRGSPSRTDRSARSATRFRSCRHPRCDREW